MALDYKKIILLTGLFLIPFYEIITRVFPSALIITPDTRVAKLSLALLFALAIGLSSLVSGVSYRISNKWLLALVGFVLISNNLSAHIPIVINSVDSASFWIWKPTSMILVYFLMFLGVQSIVITKAVSDQVCKAIFYSALIMAVYVGLQALGIDQFYVARPESQVVRPYLVGNLGQPTLVAPFIGLGIIFAYHLKKEVSAIFMMGILFLLDSKMALGGIVIATGAYIAMSKPRFTVPVLSFLVIISIITFSNLNIDEFSGRTTVWEETIYDWRVSPVEGDSVKSPVLTGNGIGSYTYLFHEKNKSTFNQAHNEPLEILYNLGLVGLGLFLMANFYCVKLAYKSQRRTWDWKRSSLTTLLTAFIFLHLVSLGTFVWQLAVYQFIGVMLFGLLSNQSLIGETK